MHLNRPIKRMRTLPRRLTIGGCPRARNWIEAKKNTTHKKKKNPLHGNITMHLFGSWMKGGVETL